MLPCHTNAFLIKPGHVLGCKLRPLTLAHYWLLEAIDSPYAWQKTRYFADTSLAVFVISNSPAMIRWMIMRPILYRTYFRAWSLFHRGHDIKSEMSAFEAYWNAYTDMPKKWSRKNSGSSAESCLPSSVGIAWAIMGKVGESRAWSMPMPLALSYFVAESEFNGGEYMTESQIKRVSKEEVKNG